MRLLEGIRVLELGQVIAGTFGTQFLGDYGAEVIKVEPPWGDLGRSMATGDLGGMSSLFASMNRNKRSVVIDLRTDRGGEVLLALAGHCDVVVENFRPGTLDRLGIGKNQLRQANPRIIFASVTGFGAEGSYADVPSFDLVHQAMSGWMSMMGEEGGPPAAIPIPIADLLAGFYLSHGVLAALVARERSGETPTVETTMLDVMLSLLTYQAAMYLNTGFTPTRRGSAHEYHVPWQAFATADGHLIVAPREEVFWRALCRAMGLSTLIEDERFRDAALRRQHRDDLVLILGPRFREHTTAEWMHLLHLEGVPAAPVRDLHEALTDPLLEERSLTVSLQPTGFRGPISVMGNPIRFEARSVDRYGPPPAIGEHTREVLSELLGYSAVQIEALERDGVIGPEAHGADSTVPREGG